LAFEPDVSRQFKAGSMSKKGEMSSPDYKSKIAQKSQIF
jgi:hypothetical protein